MFALPILVNGQVIRSFVENQKKNLNIAMPLHKSIASQQGN
jgi:hypothetical protein